MRFDYTVTKFHIDLEKYDGEPGIVDMDVNRTPFGHWMVDIEFVRAGSYRFWMSRGEDEPTKE
jgi:hypothetical protein